MQIQVRSDARVAFPDHPGQILFPGSCKSLVATQHWRATYGNNIMPQSMHELKHAKMNSAISFAHYRPNAESIGGPGSGFFLLLGRVILADVHQWPEETTEPELLGANSSLYRHR